VWRWPYLAMLFLGAAAPLLLGALRTTTIGHVVGHHSVSKPASFIAQMASGASQNSLPVQFPIHVFLDCHWNCHSPLLLFVHVILQCLSLHMLPLAAWLMSRRPRSQDGGTEVLARKCGSCDGSFEPLAMVLKKFACLGLFLYHYYTTLQEYPLAPNPWV
jgi:hypothetical protein